MKKLVIHIGAKKTGSTTLQFALKSNADVLLSKGVFVSDLCGNREDFMASRPYMSCHTLSSKTNLLQWFEAAENASSKGASLFVLTAESFSDMYKNEITDFKQDIPAIFDDVKIVLYVRRQDLAAVSHYSTKLKGGSGSKLLMSEGMGPRGRRAFSYGSIALDWACAFGEENLVVRRYVEGRAGGWDIVDDFFALLDLGLDGSSLQYSSENTSLGCVEAACLRRYNELVKKGELAEAQETKQAILRAASEDPVNSRKIPRPRKDHAQAFLKSFDEENRILKERFFKDSDCLFDSGFDMYPDHQCDLDEFIPEKVSDQLGTKNGTV